jgi:Uma2 family endonuclease
MGLAQPKPGRYTIAEYLDLEEHSEVKHEYRDGFIVPLGETLAMAGGSYWHSLITMNVGGEMRALLKGNPCRVSDANTRVRIPRKPLYVYPDASVVCGRPEFDPDDPRGQSILNPRLVVEVLSPSTEAYERGEKFERYRELASMQEYVLVSQSTPRVETFLRRADGAWLIDVFSGMEASAILRSIELTVPLTEIYAGVEFPASDTSAGSGER